MLLKCFDSDLEIAARYTAHCAFHDPSAVPGLNPMPRAVDGPGSDRSTTRPTGRDSGVNDYAIHQQDMRLALCAESLVFESVWRGRTPFHSRTDCCGFTGVFSYAGISDAVARGNMELFAKDSCRS